MNNTVELISLNWQQTLPIRHQVLWPNKKVEFCQVEGDASGLHYGILYHNKLVCVASIYTNLSKNMI